MIPRRLALWAPLVAALAGVYFLSSLSHVPGSEYVWDKLLHAVGYGGISVLALRAFHGGFVPLRSRTTIATFLFMLAWFVSDEYHQSFVPGRDAEVGDVVADAVGFGLATVAWILASLAARLRPTL